MIHSLHNVETVGDSLGAWNFRDCASGQPSKTPSSHRSDSKHESIATTFSEDHPSPSTRSPEITHDPAKWYAPLKRPEWWLVLAAFLTLGFLCWQVWETRKAAEAAAKQANHIVTSERAWVQIEMTSEPEWGSDASGEEVIWFRPVIKNYGKTPASLRLITFRPHLIQRDDNFPDPPMLPKDPDYVSLRIGRLSYHQQ